MSDSARQGSQHAFDALGEPDAAGVPGKRPLPDRLAGDLVGSRRAAPPPSAAVDTSGRPAPSGDDPFGMHLLGGDASATTRRAAVTNASTTRAGTPVVQRRAAPTAAGGIGRLVGNLLAAIDHSARNGLDALERGDRDGARSGATQAGERIAQLLSVTAAPGGGAPAVGQADAASRALGRVSALEERLRATDGQAAELLRGALDRVEVELVPQTRWSWHARAKGAAADGGLTRAEGRAIGTSTLAIVGRRADAVLASAEPGPIVASAVAIAEELRHAQRELSLAVPEQQRAALHGDILSLGASLARFEARAFQLGVGMHRAIEQVRTAEAELRQSVGLVADRAVWESALPTLQAIIDIVNVRFEVRDGLAYDRSQAVAHQKDVPAKYRPLLDEWFQVTRGRVQHVDGTTTTTRGKDLAAHIDHAVTATMPLINALNREGNPDQVGPWLEQFYAKVDQFRARATSETVQDHVDAKADRAIAAGDSPVDRLDDEMRIKVASLRLFTVARQTTSIVQRLASAHRDGTREALEQFKRQLAGVDLPAAAKEQLLQAQSLVEVTQHIVGIANGVQAIMNLADPHERERLFVKEFGRSMIGGVTELAKTLLGLVQGGIAAYKALAAGLLLARGQAGAAATLMRESAGTLGRINVALNVLNVAHGLVMVVFGSGTDRVDGAVETTWGALGLVGRWAPRLSRFTGPLAASIAISHLTIKELGKVAVGALYGMIQLGLTMSYRDMQRSAQDVHATATRLAVALESGDELQGAELGRELGKQTEALRWNLRELGLRTYIERTKKPGGNADPGTYAPLRERFEPLWNAPLQSDADLFTTTEIFLSVVVACFDDAQQILEQAVAASVREQ